MRLFFLYLIGFANLVSMVHLGLYIVGANLYDIKRMLFEGPKTKPAQKDMPLVTVVVPAFNEQTGIVRTLDSLCASTYPNTEVIVVDDGSSDDTARVVRQYIEESTLALRRARSEFQTYLARGPRGGSLERRTVQRPIGTLPRLRQVTQTNMGKGAALNNAIKNYANGDFVMCLDADATILPGSIGNAVRHLQEPGVIGIAANVRVTGDGSWLNLLQRFEHIIGYRSKKFYSLTGTEYVVGGVASTYRRKTLQEVGYYDTDTMTEDIGLSLKTIAQLGNRGKRIVYASDVVATTGGVLTYRQLIRQRYRWKMGMLQNLYKHRGLLFSNNRNYSAGMTAYRLPMAILSEILLLLSPLMIGYIVWLSATHHTFAILIGAYLTITLYVLWNIWPDEYLTLRQKLQMSVFSLYMYGLFYAMDLVQIVAIVQCLRNYKTVLRGNQGHSAWVPPTRAVPATA